MPSSQTKSGLLSVSSPMQAAYCQQDAAAPPQATGWRSRANGPIDEHLQNRPSSFSSGGFVAPDALGVLEAQRQGPSSNIEGLTRQIMLAGFYQCMPPLTSDPQSSFPPSWATSTSNPTLNSSNNWLMARNYPSLAASADVGNQQQERSRSKSEARPEQQLQDLQQQQQPFQMQQQQYRHDNQAELGWGSDNYDQPAFPGRMAMPMVSSAVPRPVQAAAAVRPQMSQGMMRSVPSSLMTAMGECSMLSIEDFLPMDSVSVSPTLRMNMFASQDGSPTLSMGDPNMDIVAALIASDSGGESDPMRASRECAQQRRHQSMDSNPTDPPLNYAAPVVRTSTGDTTIDSGGFSDSREPEDDGGWSSRSSSVAPPSDGQPRDPVRAPRPKRIRRRCTQPGCGKRARSLGLCIAHGGGKRCAVDGCNKSSQGGNMCIKHGGGKRCSFQGCDKAAQTNSLCKAHGGGPRCQFGNCMKSSQGGGLCRSHGGGKRCAVEGCDKGTQRGDLCALHGGSRLCEVAGCQRNDRGGGFCAHHGGGKRCHITNCARPCRRHGLCSAHLRLLDMSEEVKAARSGDDFDEYDEDSRVV